MVHSTCWQFPNPLISFPSPTSAGSGHFLLDIMKSYPLFMEKHSIPSFFHYRWCEQYLPFLFPSCVSSWQEIKWKRHLWVGSYLYSMWRSFIKRKNLLLLATHYDLIYSPHRFFHCSPLPCLVSTYWSYTFFPHSHPPPSSSLPLRPD